MRYVQRIFVTGISLAALLTPAYSWAAPKAPPTQEEMDEARHRYERALELSDEGNFDEALLELQRAYALAPTYRLLYNLGVVSAAVRDYVKAIDYFNRYLISGGPDLDAARITEVQTEIERLRSRVALLTVQSSVAHAQISIDDVPITAAAAQKPITVNGGRHRVTATAQGYLPATSVVELAGNDNKTVTLTLQVAVAERPPHPIPWLAYGITVGLGGASVITGILALNSAAKYDREVGAVGTSASDIKSTHEQTRILGGVTDVLIVGTIVAAGISVYLTVKPMPIKTKVMGLQVTPTGLAF